MPERKLPDFETARRLYEVENKTLQEICVMYGCSPNNAMNLSKMLKKGGVTVKRRKTTPVCAIPQYDGEPEDDYDEPMDEQAEAPRRKAGRPPGAKNKPKAAEKQTMGVAKKGDNAKVLKHNLVIAGWQKPNENNVWEVAERIKEYFDLCVKQDMAPTLSGLGLAFKVSRFTVQRWASGLDVPHEVAEQLYTAVCTIDADSTQKMVKGMVHPKSGEFIMRNTLGYRDEVTVVTERAEHKQTVAEIQAKYAKLLGE